MNILVCIARTPDTTARIAFTDGGRRFDAVGVQFIINPYDEFALARAVELKEEKGAHLTIITVDTAEADQLLRKCLAIGADEAVRISATPTDASYVVNLIADWIEQAGKKFDIIFTGKETIDFNGGQVGALLACRLGYTYLPDTYRFAVEEDNTVNATLEIEGGRMKVTARLPVVASAVEYLAEPRIPTMKGIVSARTKPFHVVEPQQASPTVIYEKFETPPPRKECLFIDKDNIEELVEILAKEVKVL